MISKETVAGRGNAVTLKYVNQSSKLCLADGVLCRRWVSGGGGKSDRLLPVMPLSLRKEVIVAAHVSVSGKHRSLRQTRVQLRRYAYWVGMDADAEKVLCKCKCREGQVTEPDVSVSADNGRVAVLSSGGAGPAVVSCSQSGAGDVTDGGLVNCQTVVKQPVESRNVMKCAAQTAVVSRERPGVAAASATENRVDTGGGRHPVSSEHEEVSDLQLLSPEVV